MKDKSGLENLNINFSFLYFSKLVYRRKLYILFIVLLSIFLTTLYLKQVDYLYSITLQVTDASDSNNSVKNGIGSSFAQAVGLKINNDIPKLFSLYKSLLKTRHVSEEIWVNNSELVRKIFYNHWDDSKNTWSIPVINNSFLIKNYIKSFLGLPLSKLKSVSAINLHRLVLGSLIISTNADETITRLTIYSNRPDISKELLLTLHQTANDLLQKRVLDRTNNNIQFLLNQLSKTSNRDHKASLVATLNEQQKKRMMASSNLPFVADPIGNIVISDGPIKPNGKIILVLSTFLSLFFSVIIFILIDKIKTKK